MRSTRPLSVILLVSYAARVALAFGGGQDYWPDESRYQGSQYAVDHLMHGQWRLAAGDLLGHADHLLFRWFGLPAALGEYFVGHHPHYVACYFSLFSVLAIYLVWLVARRAGAGEREALVAAFLAACSNSLFYYSRHFFPYDIALCLLLLALYVALGPWSWRNSLVVGILAGLGFLTYDGYWWLGGCVLILHGIMGAGGPRRLPARVWWSAVGLVLPIVTVVLAGRAFGFDLIAAYRKFAGTVTQGNFGFGYRVMPEYLWSSEGLLFLLWLGASGYAVRDAVHEARWHRSHWWLGSLVLVAGGYLLLSDVFHVFVVYGRQVRVLVPFFCLVTAYAWERWTARRTVPRVVWLGGATTVLAVAAWNFHYPLTQVFPNQFLGVARARVFRDQEKYGYGLYRMVFAESLWGKEVAVTLPPHRVVLRLRNPMQFRPYQFEGFSRKQRRAFKSHDISMRVIRLTATGHGAPLDLPRSAPRWGDYPGPVAMRVVFPRRPEGPGQPLVTCGVPGRGDFLYMTAEADHRVRFGYDDWGAESFLSAPVAVDPTRSHELIVSFGSLYPPSDAAGPAAPDVAQLRNYLVVVLDGRTIFSQRAPFHPVRPMTITFGANFIGGSSTVADYHGTIIRVERAKRGGILPRIAPFAARATAALRSAAWHGAIGPVRMEIAPSSIPKDEAQPLLAVGRPGEGGLIYCIREPDGRIRLGYAQSGQGAVLSEPMHPNSGLVADVLISVGSLMPPPGSPYYRDHPDYRRLRNIVYAALDGRVAFEVNQPYDATEHEPTFAANTVSSPVADAFFTGNVLAVRPADPLAVVPSSQRLTNMVVPRPGWDGFPGPIRIRLRFAGHPLKGGEPIVVSGLPGRGDFLFVRFEGERRLQFGFDHWGGAGLLSPPIEFDPKKEHEILVSLGSLYPEQASFYAAHPALRRLRRWVWLTFDGRPVFAAPAQFHPCTPSEITLGANRIGGSTCGSNLSAQILSVDTIPMAEIRERIIGLIAQGPKEPGREWYGYSGPVKMTVRIPDLARGASEPLITTGQTGAGDCLFLRRDADGRFRLGFDHWGVPDVLMSEPFEMKVDSVHAFVVSIGSLYPPASASLFAVHPDWRFLLTHVFVTIDGRPVLYGSRPAFTSPPADIDYGENQIGISTAGRLFSGQITSVARVPVAEILHEWKPAAPDRAAKDH